MKDKLAIAAVLNTIRTHLELRMRSQLAGLNIDVTVQPPDKIPDDRNVVNLFLYDLRLNTAFRNDPMPGRVRNGEVAPPPLPLDLYFLLSVFALDNADLNDQRILGLALSILHDTPVLGTVTLTDGTGAYTYDRAERIRLAPNQLTLDELTKIWTGFKGPIVPSMSYQVSVVLLESDRPVVVPPPVLRRGESDTGPKAVGSPVPPFPNIEELVYGGTDPIEISRRPRRQPVFERDDRLLIRGTALIGTSTTTVQLRPPGTGPVVSLPLDAALPTEIGCRLAGALAGQAGPYRVWVEVPTRSGQPPLRSSEVPLLVAPIITNRTPKLTFPPPPTAADPRPPQPFALTCDVALLPTQEVRLLVNGNEVARNAVTTPTQQADFMVPELPEGAFPIRLRVDGVDSLPVSVAGQIAIGEGVTVEHL